jgi:hypothetical protein
MKKTISCLPPISLKSPRTLLSTNSQNEIDVLIVLNSESPGSAAQQIRGNPKVCLM